MRGIRTAHFEVLSYDGIRNDAPIKLFRYRRPSLKTLLGITAAKKRIKKDLGITALLKPLRWWPNEKRRIKRQIGYESEAGRLVRDGLPRAGGCLVMVIIAIFRRWLYPFEPLIAFETLGGVGLPGDFPFAA